MGLNVYSDVSYKKIVEFFPSIFQIYRCSNGAKNRKTYLFVFQSYAYKYISFISLSNVWLNVEYTHGNRSLNIAVNKY